MTLLAAVVHWIWGRKGGHAQSHQAPRWRLGFTTPSGLPQAYRRQDIESGAVRAPARRRSAHPLQPALRALWRWL